jgi:ABC-type uncharacterized transport system ATPase component
VRVTHNPENCIYADRTIILKDGRIVVETRELVASEICDLASLREMKEFANLWGNV